MGCVKIKRNQHIFNFMNRDDVRLHPWFHTFLENTSRNIPLPANGYNESCLFVLKVKKRKNAINLWPLLSKGETFSTIILHCTFLPVAKLPHFMHDVYLQSHYFMYNNTNQFVHITLMYAHYYPVLHLLINTVPKFESKHCKT